MQSSAFTVSIALSVSLTSLFLLNLFLDIALKPLMNFLNVI